MLGLFGLLAAWFALRVVLWQPLADAALHAVPKLAQEPEVRERLVIASLGAPFAIVAGRAAAQLVPIPGRYLADTSDAAERATPMAFPPPPDPLAVDQPVEGTFTRQSPVRVAVGHSLLLAAGLSQMELPPALAAYLNPAPAQPGVPAAAPFLTSLPQHALSGAGSRWSGDAWLMMRQDTTTAVASGRPSYGRSQAGAVVRYRLAPSNAHAPQVYARASSALAGPPERDVVAGLSARPVPRVPLRVALEARVSETGQGTELRPAAIAITEFPPVALPRGLRGEAYLQGGYVGGRFATAFVDGQGRIEGSVARFGETEVRAGVGAWGGAQEGAARLDVGPTAAASFRLGDARGRIAADYRFRVAGDAEPQSGPALTLSAGF